MGRAADGGVIELADDLNPARTAKARTASRWRRTLPLSGPTLAAPEVRRSRLFSVIAQYWV